MSSHILIAYLSRRLTGELEVWVGLCRPYVDMCVSTFSNIFSSETTGPIEDKLHVDPPLDGGT